MIRCKGCQKLLDNTVFWETNSEASILLLGGGPSTTELKEQRVFMGESGVFLREALKAIGAPPVHLGNVTLCHLGKGKSPGMVYRRQCRNTCITQLLAEVKPSFIVCLGNTPFQSLQNDGNISLTRNRHKTYWYKPWLYVSQELDLDWDWIPDERGIPYSVTWSADYPMRRIKHSVDWWLSDLYKYLVKQTWKRDPLETRFLIKDSIPPALMDCEELVLDVETTGKDLDKDRLRCFGVKREEGPVYLIVENPKHLKEQVNKLIMSDKLIVGHNLAFDLQTGLDKREIPKCRALDTMYLHFLLDERYPIRTLKHLTRLYTPYEPLDLPHGGTKHTLEEIMPYNASDVLATQLVLRGVQEDFIREEYMPAELIQLYGRIIPILAAISRTGVNIDRERLQQQQTFAELQVEDIKARMQAVWDEHPHYEFLDILEALENRDSDIAFDEDDGELADLDSLWECVGMEEILDKPHILSRYIFETLKVPVPDMPGIYRIDGNPRTKKEVLEEIIRLGTDPSGFCEALTQYREISGQKKRYVDDFAMRVSTVDGHIRPDISIIKYFLSDKDKGGAVTGRWGISRPALHNVPRGHPMRRAIIPLEGDEYLFATDRCSAELTDLAQVSKDPQLIQAIANGEDLHSWMVDAAAEAGKPIEGRSFKEKRSKAKNVNFGILYGISAFGMAQRGWFQEEEAEFLIEEVWFGRFKKVRELRDATAKSIYHNGYAEGPQKRRRRFPKHTHPDSGDGRDYLRKGFNHIIQGTQNDINGLILVLWCDKGLAELAFPVMVKHDEIVFSTKDWRETARQLKILYQEDLAEQTSRLLHLNILAPMRGDMHVGRNWGRMHKIGRVSTS